MKQITNKLIATAATLLLSSCALNPSTQPSPSKQMVSYQKQLDTWREQQAQHRDDQSQQRTQDAYYLYLDTGMKLQEKIQEEKTKQKAIEENPVFPSSAPEGNDSGKQDNELRQKCMDGFDCQSGDCKYPPDDLCSSLFGLGASGSASRGSPSRGQSVYFIGSSIGGDFIYMSPGASGSDRSARTDRARKGGVGDMAKAYRLPPPPAPPKSAHEIWGGVISGVWRDTLGFGRAVAPWFFGADVLKTAITAPNNYVSVGDDLTAGGTNNTERGDYVRTETEAPTEAP